MCIANDRRVNLVCMALTVLIAATCQLNAQLEAYGRATTTTTLQEDVAPVSRQDDPPIVCAFFGLDNELPLRANLLVRGAFGKDGMPVSFRDEIDASTLDASDFLVIDRQGNKHTPIGVTLRPADEEGENRTVLLIGEFGDAETNPPIEVQIVGELRTVKKRSEASAPSVARDLKGAATKNIIPLDAGPKMFFAQIITGDLAEPQSKTGQVVQVAWEGGITPFDTSVAEKDLFQFYKVYVDRSGELISLTPSLIADVNDNDNFHQLLVDSNHRIIKVTIQADVVKDPNGDPNPATEVEVGYQAQEFRNEND